MGKMGVGVVVAAATVFIPVFFFFLFGTDGWTVHVVLVCFI